MLKLTELINLEVQLLKDAEADPVKIRTRDRAIGQKLVEKNISRPQMFLQWLARVGEKEATVPGELYSTAIRIVRYILFFSGLAVGLSTGSGVLHFDGTQPVNVVNFLAIFLGMQFITYILFFLNCLPQKLQNVFPFLGDFYNVLRRFSELIARNSTRFLGEVSQAKIHQYFDTLNRIRRRQIIYQKIEKWLLVGLTQTFSLAFNLGALVICVYLIVFSDLAFAWNTTLTLQNESFHQIVHVLSQPWQEIFPDAVPSLDLVEKTRFFRLEGEYLNAINSQRSADVRALGGWWPFLVASLFFYGLVPRILLYAIARWRFNKNIKRVPFNTADFSALYERLMTPVVQTRANIPQSNNNLDQNEELRSQIHIQPAGDFCIVIYWGEFQLAEEELKLLLSQRFGWQIKEKYEAGLFDNYSDTTALGKFSKSKNEMESIVVLVESWETPSKAIKYFLQNLRQYILPDRPIIVGLINTTPAENLAPLLEDWQSWQNEMAPLADPYLRVEPMVEEIQ
ncbi:MAG: DUF2868 domain-containing protein [Calditrichaeota bacterium]|nr:MAG: DUF2868 domain-containing protein [Calditrichota bacterium]